MLDILSWNIQQGGGSRVSSIVKALVDQAPEIIILSEYKNNDKGVKIREMLLRAGYRFQAVTAAKSQDNSVLIASKLACGVVQHPKADELYASNILEITLDAFHVIGVYLPHKKKHQLIPYIQKVIAASEKPYIIAGDYNTGINGIDQAGKSFWYEGEMKDFAVIGYYDAFRHLKGDVKEYSWFSHQGNGYRYDHTYVHESLLPIIKECRYLHTWREEKLADHSPMILSF